MILKISRTLSKATFLSILSATALMAQSPEKHYLIKAGQMYDSEKNIFVKDQQILVRGKKIVKVGTRLETPPNTEVLDFSRATVTPGLVDAHTHLLTNQGLRETVAVDAVMRSSEERILRAAGFAKSYLAAGFTTIRDVGNSGQYLDVEMRRAIEKGYISGPRMFVSGPIIGSMDGQLSAGIPIKEFDHIARSEQTLVSGVEEARKAVREHIARGVDVIKILAIGDRLTLGLEEMKAIVETAHSERVKVTAHCDRDWAVHAAIEAGVDGVEHLYGFKDATLEKMAQKGIYAVPTYATAELRAQYMDILHMEYKMEDLRKDFEQSFGKWVGQIRKAGVMIVAGSDAYMDGGTSRGASAKETIDAYRQSGMPVEDVMKTTTANAAKILDMEGAIGVIKENAFADIAVFNGDLTKDFRKSLFDVELVMKEGGIEFRKAKP